MFHLVSRFFGFLRAQPLSPSEQDVVCASLPTSLRALFFAQRREDQRHAFDVLSRVGSTEAAIVEAALLHDVGKTASRMGAVQRSLATIAGYLGIPLRRRWATYLDHGRLGADVLEGAGAGPLAVAFARFHPGPVPDGIDPGSWQLLADADDA